MTTTLIQWNGKQGSAQTDSGGQYPVARHQLDYAPYAIGSRIRIDVANGQVVNDSPLPAAASVAEAEQGMGQPIRGFNLSLPRWAAFVLMLGALVLLAQTAVLSLLGVGGIKAYAKTFISYFVPLAMVFTVVRQCRQVTCIPNGIVVAGGRQFLAWRDISRIEIQPSPVFRLPCLLVHSNTDQPALRINLFLLAPKQREALQTIIRSHIQAA